MRHDPLGWILPSLIYTAVIVLIAVQASKPGKAVQAVEHWPTESVAPAVLYYGPRDTSVTRWVCCRVVGL